MASTWRKESDEPDHTHSASRQASAVASVAPDTHTVSQAMTNATPLTSRRHSATGTRLSC